MVSLVVTAMQEDLLQRLNAELWHAHRSKRDMIVFNICLGLDQTALNHGANHTSHSGYPLAVASHQAVKYKVEWVGWHGQFHL